jgi:pyruvate dehydrogenase kinase 2/3/4
MPGTDDILDKIRYLAQFTQRPVKLSQLFEFGRSPTSNVLMTAAQFLHQELPVRLAHRVAELESLPCGLSEMPSVRSVRGMYIDSISDLNQLARPDTTESELAFTQSIEAIKRRHNNVVSIMAKGIQELKQMRGSEALDPRIQAFLDRFYLSRIGVRMLIGQHISLHDPPRPGFAGLISQRCSPREMIRRAMESARSLCVERYGCAPELGVYGRAELVFTYISSHLHHMLFELLKNSLRAVVERHGSREESLPRVRVVIAEGEEDVTIKISDEGGGIPRSGIDRIWTYLYSTAPPPSDGFEIEHENDFSAPMAGLGYGLPLSRLYARYFGGDLQILSMEGFGTDAYLHLKRLATTEENVPRKLL